MNPSLAAHLSTVISNETLCSFTLSKSTLVGGGSINEAYRLEGTDGARYFLKLNDAQHLTMFVAEAKGLETIIATNTIRVPRAIAHGTSGKQSFLVLEYLELSSRGDAKLLGEQLAALHRCTSYKIDFEPSNPITTTSPLPCRRITSDLLAYGLSRMAITNDLHSVFCWVSQMASSLISCSVKDGMGVEVREGGISTPSLTLPLQGEGDSGTTSLFGFSTDNFIGTTPQPNGWKNSWIDFWREHRLGFQLQLAEQNGYGGHLQSLGEKLMDALPAFFAGYTPQPSLLHGDLWSGNHAFLADGTPTIFDPATYYGDRECDLAMTELFGGYPANFYAAYRAAYPLNADYSTRRDLYNLYHLLNHANLFGGGYARQAEQMMQRLLAEVEG